MENCFVAYKMNMLFGLAFFFVFQSRSYLSPVLSVYFIIIIFLCKDNAKGISLCCLSSLLSLNKGVGC